MKFLECFMASLKLGLTSFGGPVAHLAYFREAYVERLKWLNDQKFAELLAICQFMPGPASSQLGAAIGYHRGGWLGGLAAWLGFTLPSAVLLIILASNLDNINSWVGSGWIHGLKVVAVAVVAMAIIGMKKKLCPDVKTTVIALVVAVVLCFVREAWLQPLMILAGGVLGAFLFKGAGSEKSVVEKKEKKKFPRMSLVGLSLFVVATIGLSWMTISSNDGQMMRGMVKTGAMVFGGGHVVLPLLEAEVVNTGLMKQQEFLAGYGAAQAVPGPMFTLSAFLGAQVPMFGNSWVGGLVALACIFLPGMILLSIGMPLWNYFKDNAVVRSGLSGANAAVVGLLIAALVHILRAGALTGWIDVAVAVALFAVLYSKKAPVWSIVLVGAVIGGVVG